MLVLVCALGGAVDLFNNSFALVAAPMATFPEEEENVGKDRASLVAANQPTRRGSIRPFSRIHQQSNGRGPCVTVTRPKPAPMPADSVLSGAGIFLRC